MVRIVLLVVFGFAASVQAQCRPSWGGYSSPAYRSQPSWGSFPPNWYYPSPSYTQSRPVEVASDIKVLLPADSELWATNAQGQWYNLGTKPGTVRELRSPLLTKGSGYYYDFKVHVGKEKIERRKRVYIRAGESVEVDLRPQPDAKDRPKAAQIVVKVLPGTELFYKEKGQKEWVSLGEKGVLRTLSLTNGEGESEVVLLAVSKGPPRVERTTIVRYQGGDEREVDLAYSIEGNK